MRGFFVGDHLIKFEKAELFTDELNDCYENFINYPEEFDEVNLKDILGIMEKYDQRTRKFVFKIN